MFMHAQQASKIDRLETTVHSSAMRERWRKLALSDEYACLAHCKESAMFIDHEASISV